MERIKNNSPRPHWESIIKAEGLTYSQFSPEDTHYWREDSFYKLTEKDLEKLKAAVEELHERLQTEIIPFILEETPWLDYYGLNKEAIELIKKSWYRGEELFYGRFDFIPVANNKDGFSLKLLEFNADTPTGMVESAISQKNLFKATAAQGTGNFHHNEMNEYFTERWGYFFNKSDYKLLHLACVNPEVDPSGEDSAQIKYLAGLAREAGWETKEIFIDQLRWNIDHWEDTDGVLVKNLFKIYPWEDIMFDPFETNEEGEVTYTMAEILTVDGGYDAMDNWFEPAWKMLFSNKILLAVLWDYFAGSTDEEDKEIIKLLVPAFISDDFNLGDIRNFVKKPMFGREGDGIEIEAPDYSISESRTDGYMTANTPEEEYIYQEFIKPMDFIDPSSDGTRIVHPMIGAWVGADNKLKGISIREHANYITDTDCNFIPNFVDKNTGSFFSKF